MTRRHPCGHGVFHDHRDGGRRFPRAAGYAGSFHATLSVLARETGADPAGLTVAVTVAVGPDPAGAGSLLRTEVAVTWPGSDDVRRLVERAKPGAHTRNCARRRRGPGRR
ncbi:hypothetical protein [Amycolatopsis sp. NPDC051061]|uniref:hypothetical protein n=1 Tax=Amycolatopsis sp. NPDC051061 TaxID=3155042 RepID=UPI00344AC033